MLKSLAYRRSDTINQPAWRSFRSAVVTSISGSMTAPRAGPNTIASSRSGWRRADGRWWPTRPPASGADLTVNEILLAYFHHADTYCVKNGKPTTEPVNIGLALRPLRQLYSMAILWPVNLGLSGSRRFASRFLCCRFRPESRWGLDAMAGGLRISTRSARRGFHSAELAGLLAVEREPGCKLAVSVLDLPEPEAGPKRRPLYGPIPWRWWLPASLLPGRSPQVASVCWLSAGRSRSADFELALDGWAEFGLSRFSASRGLDELERAGLVSVGRTPGGSPVVTILDATATNC
jgi:hypothetical protein